MGKAEERRKGEGKNWNIIWRREWVWRRPGEGEDAGAGFEFVLSLAGLLRPRPSLRIASLCWAVCDLSSTSSSCSETRS